MLLMDAGACNVALFSFEDVDAEGKKIVNASPALAWSDIFGASSQLHRECLNNNEGGAVVVKGEVRDHHSCRLIRTC